MTNIVVKNSSNHPRDTTPSVNIIKATLAYRYGSHPNVPNVLQGIFLENGDVEIT